MTKVLFIGNSHTYFNDLPGIFKKLCRDKGKEVHVAMLCKGGMGLDRRPASTSFTGSTITWYCSTPLTPWAILT